MSALMSFDLLPLHSSWRLRPNHVHFLVVKARLSHRQFVHIFTGHLIRHLELWNMLGCGKCIGEWIKILESVLMSLVHRKGRPLSLEVEVDEASRARL